MAYTTINKSTDYFNTKLYTGNSTGSTTQAITGVGFQPDWVWLKSRDTAERHWLVDAVRGVTKGICSHTTDAEFSNISMVSFDSNGFTVGTDNYSINKNNDKYASWNWKANGAGSANTSGSINSTVSANTTAGFSIVKYTGTGANATVGHGLGSPPKMILTKNLQQNNEGWLVYHASMGNTQRAWLNATGSFGTDATAWNSTTPTDDVFSIGTNWGSNGNGHPMIAYCFAEKTGYSKMGKYTGNNSDDGPFIWCGFKPKFVFIKNTHDATNWSVTDDFRDGYNTAGNKILYPNTSGTEDSSYAPIDHLSNGFKIRLNTEGYNGNGGDYIYMAIGQSLVGSNNVPCTAR